MYGAIIGDMVGAPFERDKGMKTKDFELFGKGSRFTDDTVMTIAVAYALMKTRGKDCDVVEDVLVKQMRFWGRMYPNAGYGSAFSAWLTAKDPKPYNSYGNGSAMRVSSVGWMFDNMLDTRICARRTAEVSHNHPEGVKGACAVSSAIFLARTGRTKDEIRRYIERRYGYDLSRTCDEIRPTYKHDATCQGSVPEAITAFLEGNDFEDVIRTAVSLGGDTDTIACIAGSIAEGCYEIPGFMMDEMMKRLDDRMKDVLLMFERYKA